MIADDMMNDDKFKMIWYKPHLGVLFYTNIINVQVCMFDVR